jgi:Phosphotransferase enzyme family
VTGLEQTPLGGGNVSSPVRVGEHVHRRTHDRSGYVHELLRFLAVHDFSGSPRLTGMDQDGREVLQYVPGDVDAGGPTPDWMGHGGPLESVVSVVRRLHDLTAATPLAQGPEVVCHGDIAARNIVFRGRLAVCLLDWDLVAPGPRVKDLALMARRLLNLGPGGPPAAAQGGRIQALLDACGLQDRDGFVFRIIEYQASIISPIAGIAAEGDYRYQAMVHRWGAHRDHAAAVLAWLVDHARDLQQALIT